MFQAACRDPVYVPTLHMRTYVPSHITSDRQVQEKNEFGDVKTAVKCVHILPYPRTLPTTN